MNEISLTAEQKESVGDIVTDNFGAHFQTGRYAGHSDWVYVIVEVGPRHFTDFYYIEPNGKVHRNPA